MLASKASESLADVTCRLDLDLRWHAQVRSPMAEYSEAEARAALARTEATHSRQGW